MKKSYWYCTIIDSGSGASVNDLCAQNDVIIDCDVTQMLLTDAMQNCLQISHHNKIFEVTTRMNIRGIFFSYGDIDLFKYDILSLNVQVA